MKSWEEIKDQRDFYLSYNNSTVHAPNYTIISAKDKEEVNIKQNNMRLMLKPINQETAMKDFFSFAQRYCEVKEYAESTKRF